MLLLLVAARISLVILEWERWSKMDELYKRVLHVLGAACAGVVLACTLDYAPRIINRFDENVVDGAFVEPLDNFLDGLIYAADKIPTSQPREDR